MTDPSREERPASQLEERRPIGTPMLALLALAGAVAVGGLAFWWLGRPPAAPPPTAPAVAPAAAPAPPVDAGPAPAAAPADPGAAARALLEAVSSSATYRAWLSAGDPLNRWALAIDNLAEGASPRRALAPLAPRGTFSVVERGGRSWVAPAAFRRYDAFGDAVASVDPGALAAAYRGLHPVLEAAWRALGDPHGSLDAAAARALTRLAAAPVARGELEVAAAGSGVFVLADPALEALGPVEKHLLRLGPRNGRIVHDQVLALQRVLGLPPPRR